MPFRHRVFVPIFFSFVAKRFPLQSLLQVAICLQIYFNGYIYTIMLTQIEHIGIAVSDLETAIPLYEKLLHTPCYKREVVASEHVETAFFAVGPNKIELVQSTNPDGVIAKYIAKKGEGMHHIAYAVADIKAEMQRLQHQGFTLLNPEPKNGADNKLVCFVHPKDAGGVLMELCQEKE
jgi:methylmalonyl-CoA/ethylmalonyl-CoA epimerase